MLRLAVCKLYRARYGRADDVMTVSLSSCTQQVLAVDMSQLDPKLVTAMERHKLFGLVQARTCLAWHDLLMWAQCVHAATQYTRVNTSTSVGMYLPRYSCLGQLCSGQRSYNAAALRFDP